MQSKGSSCHSNVLMVVCSLAPQYVCAQLFWGTRSTVLHAPCLSRSMLLYPLFFKTCPRVERVDSIKLWGVRFCTQIFSGKKKAHTLLTHELFKNSVNPGTTSRLTRRKRLFSWVRSRTHKLSCPDNRSVVPGSTGPWPEQKVYVHVPFSLPRFAQ